jgi:hypothetical protein
MEQREPKYDQYVEHQFKADSWKRIDQANVIIEEYAEQGFRLTLRQLFYQFVARDLIKNTQKEYKNLGTLVRNARLAGFISMQAIEDRTRGVEALSTWDDPKDLLGAAAREFRYDKWENQTVRVEVWYEKDALAGVFEQACAQYEIPHVSTRGYASLSLVYEAAERFKQWDDLSGQNVVLLHFTDHDASGIDMTDDLTNRFGADCFDAWVDVRRIALTMEQVEQYDPPPNYAKATDSRHEKYILRTGTHECWELDALSPQVLADLVREEVEGLIDSDAWEEATERENEAREALQRNANEFEVA